MEKMQSFGVTGTLSEEKKKKKKGEGGGLDNSEGQLDGSE